MSHNKLKIHSDRQFSYNAKPAGADRSGTEMGSLWFVDGGGGCRKTDNSETPGLLNCMLLDAQVSCDSHFTFLISSMNRYRCKVKTILIKCIPEWGSQKGEVRACKLYYDRLSILIE